jgi:hypothetical protein
MKVPMSLLFMAMLGAAPVHAGEIYGVIKEGDKPVAEGVQVEAATSAKTYTAKTDARGGYRLFIDENGKATLTVHYNQQSPGMEIFSFEGSTRYDLILDKKDGKLVLRRK